MADPWDMDWSGAVVMGSAGGGGKNGLSGAENTELVKARDANQSGRNVFPNLAATLRVASRYPGGNVNATLDKGFLGVGSNAPQAQDYALFKKYAMRAAVAQAKLLGTNPTDRDFKVSYESGATPEDRYGNNKEIIGQDYSKAARNYFDNAMRQRFATRYGGTNGKGPNGESYSEYLANAMRRPEVQRLIAPPWQRGKSAAKPQASAVAGGDLHQGEDGVYVWNPKGK